MTNEEQTIEARQTAIDLAATDLNNPAWGKAKPVHLTRYWSGEPAPTGRHAEARILWSSAALHVRFGCHENELLVVSSKPQTSKKSIGLWDRDVCEIFIAPDPSVIERYYEFEAAPTGEWLDVAIHWMPDKRESDWHFHSGMTVASDLNHDPRILVKHGYFMIGMRIPWNDWIHEPNKGERWRVNLFRCVGKDPERGYLTWRPTRTPQPNFHVPQVFGWLVFK